MTSGSLAPRANIKAWPAAQANADSEVRPIENLLARLYGVRERGPGRWSALCPAHQDRRPSLSVKEASDGRVLVYCWAGCSTVDVITAVGLTMADLFPDDGSRRPPTPEERRDRQRAAEEAALATWLNQTCDEAYRRLASWYRTISDQFAQRGTESPEWLIAWVYELPVMEYTLDSLLSGDIREKLSALREVQRWLR